LQHTSPTTDRYPCPGKIRTHNLCRRTAGDLRLRPLGHRERQFCILLGVKYKSVPKNISELGLVSTVFEVLVTHSQNKIVQLFVLSMSCLFSNYVPELGAEKHPDVRPHYAPIQSSCPVSTAAVHVGATCTFSLL
jgi:hypothetical protein